MNLETSSLLTRLSKKYRERVKKLELEGDLIDNCKFMLYMNNGWLVSGECSSYPVKSITEAVRVVKESEKK